MHGDIRALRNPCIEESVHFQMKPGIAKQNVELTIEQVTKVKNPLYGLFKNIAASCS